MLAEIETKRAFAQPVCSKDAGELLQSAASALTSTHPTANFKPRRARALSCQHGKPGCSQTPPTTTATLTDRPRLHDTSPSADRNTPLDRTPTDRGLRGTSSRSTAPMTPAFAALNPNLGQLDPNGPNQGVVIGLDEDAPFRAALGQIKALLDTLGVEGTVAKIKPAEPDGPIIPRDYEVGLQPGTDRLRACPSNAKCLSGTRGEKKFTPPFVFFDQKGDAVGNLLERDRLGY